MGQWYDVTIEGKVKDPALLVKLTNEYIATENFRADCWDESNLTTAEGCIRALLAGDTQPAMYKVLTQPSGNVRYHNSFSCCYSWESVLSLWFQAIAPSLEDGTMIEVWPDNGSWIHEVEKGVAI